MNALPISRRSPFDRFLSSLLFLAVLALPVGAGVLTYLELFVDGNNAEGLGGASGVAFSPDGRNVYVTGSADNGIAIFRRDVSAESLTFVRDVRDGQNGVFGLAGASAIASSPDGRVVAATGFLDDTLAFFRRDVSTDNLQLRDVKQDGVGGTFGLGAPTAVAFSDDDQRVFVAGSSTNSVAVFRRDVSADSLVFVEAQLGSNVPGLAAPSSLAVSGDYVFATGRDSDMVVMFHRVAPSEGLTWVDSVAVGVGCEPSSVTALPPDHVSLPVPLILVGCPGTGQMAIIAWTAAGLDAPLYTPLAAPQPGGKWALTQTKGALFIAGPDGNRLVVWDKVANSFIEVEDFDSTLIPQLEGAVAVAALPSGETAWVVSFDASALLSFEHTLFTDGFESGTTAYWSRTIVN